jgi:aspartyl-tRNA(Asn)/glutamyl-tRNA(Gln) amidotransferase subunit A
MTTTDATTWTVASARAAFASGDTTPRVLLERTVERIRALDGDLGAVLEILPAAAEAADEASRRWRSGTPRPLEGVPFGIKDNIQVRGLRTSFGSAAFHGHVAETTASAVTKLVDAGAVLTARLATYEFAAGPTDDTGNPWSLDRRSGGSSSGPCAAVASRLLPLALGTDTGGSIRVPAAWCGVCGLKPTYGRLPLDGIAPLSWSLDHVGPLARTAEDVALAMEALSGEPMHLGGGVSDLARFTLGRPRSWFFDSCDPEIAGAADAAISVLAAAGAKITDVDIPEVHRVDADLLKHILVGAEAASFHEPMRDRWGEYTSGLQDLLEFGSALSATDYVRAQRLRKQLFDAVQGVFDTVDVLVMPTSGISAPPRDADVVWRDGVPEPLGEVVARNTSLFNITGHPALTVPCGFTQEGLPIGLQIVARPWHDATCLAVGHALQQLTDHHLQAPALATPNQPRHASERKP